jgi:hypothetical protein
VSTAAPIRTQSAATALLKPSNQEARRARFADTSCSPIRMPKIVITAKVRTLLAELDAVMQAFHGHTATLAQPGIETQQAVEVGRIREDVRAQIVGIAWQLNKASTGQNDE